MPAALHVSHVAKAFGGVPVLRDISFSLHPGELTVLAGENGAGKSTLMKIVTGQLRPDAGHVHVDGTELQHPDPKLARNLGVGIVPQELAPYPELTVYENLFVGRELHTRLGTLDRREMAARAREMLATLGVQLDVKTRMGDLPIALVQLVEIAKATTWGAKVLLLDEPTSTIPDREVERLYEVVRTLKSQRVAMLYTTHRMAEIEELADHVVVLRDGQLVLDAPLAETTPDGIVQAMIGRELDNLFPEITPAGSPAGSPAGTPAGSPAGSPAGTEAGLSVRGLQLHTGGPTVDLDVRKGEILGLGGLVGAGRSEIVEAVFGVRPSVAGTIEIDGRRVRRGHVRDAIRAGISLVPEDRKGAGLVLTQSVLDNGSLPHLSAFSTAGWLRERTRSAAVSAATESVRLKSTGLGQLVGNLSGGNQQKIVLARWLTRDCSVLLLDEPTRGVDVGARGEIYSIVRDLAADGLTVVLVSSDMPELIGLSHRVLVIRAGGIAGELTRQQLDADDAQERIFRYASGQETGERDGAA
ncbi:sugar ABC transporter ATP-binding protein [Mycolicibacterium palauense]|uniref:sugar ABC transporter ATP-binding protein n=1 Tax=Mycolicibacterium palauense TaxID=2034511 RepID=UPI000BFF1177|nr:sugar ABC transporter ATP-binding protein [Mycolicibacterium palauense]